MTMQFQDDWFDSEHHGGQVSEGWGRKYFTFEEGYTHLYVCPPCRKDFKYNYLTGFVHFKMGVNGRDRFLCSDSTKHAFLFKNPHFLEKIEDHSILNQTCPACVRWQQDPKANERFRPVQRTFWNVLVAGRQALGMQQVQWYDQPIFDMMMAGHTIDKGLKEIYTREGNISSPYGALFVIIGRTGKNQYDTEYTVNLEPRSWVPVSFFPTDKNGNPWADGTRHIVPASWWQLIEENLYAPDGLGDMFRAMADLVKPYEEMAQLVQSAPTQDGGGMTLSAPQGGWGSFPQSPPQGQQPSMFQQQGGGGGRDTAPSWVSPGPAAPPPPAPAAPAPTPVPWATSTPGGNTPPPSQTNPAWMNAGPPTAPPIAVAEKPAAPPIPAEWQDASAPNGIPAGIPASEAVKDQYYNVDGVLARHYAKDQTTAWFVDDAGTPLGCALTAHVVPSTADGDGPF